MKKLLGTLERIASAGERIADSLEAVLRFSSSPASDLSPVLASLAMNLARLADHLAPAPAAVVGTPYVAGRLGCTTVWVAEMVRRGEIPGGCVVPGTGNGKPWRFYRDKIDQWIESR